MRGVMHGNHAFPVIWPPLHILRVTGLHVLDLAQLSLVIHLFDEREVEIFRVTESIFVEAWFRQFDRGMGARIGRRHVGGVRYLPC